MSKFLGVTVQLWSVAWGFGAIGFWGQWGFVATGLELATGWGAARGQDQNVADDSVPRAAQEQSRRGHRPALGGLPGLQGVRLKQAEAPGHHPAPPVVF